MRTRRITQVLGVLAINPYFVYLSSRLTYQGGLKGVCVPALNCYACPLAVFSCPIGSLQHSFTLMSPRIKGSLSQAFASLFYVLGSVGLVGAVVGRMPCGWICPFGFLQELLYKIPTPKLRLPSWARWGRYAFLAGLVALVPFLTATSWFSRLCPAGALEGGIPLKLVPPTTPLPPSGWFFWMKMVILAVFLIWFVFSRRPFCRTVCPLGAILGICNRFSLYRMAVDDSSCTSCGLCREVCPVDIDVRDDPNSPDCVRCLQCKKACPNGAVTSGFKSQGEAYRAVKRMPAVSSAKFRRKSCSLR
ncbi:MAG: 4Fe-4S binding protein [Actinobacteria bacterium]|nr:4Fe-4S binding protein [Actinomycetota bacterium]